MIDGGGIIHTVAGNGTSTYTGDGGLATDAGVDNPGGLGFDNCGNLFISEVGGPAVIREVIFDTSCHIHAAQNVGVNNIVKLTDVKTYPNPTTDILHIETPTATYYTLINMLGAIMQQGDLKSGDNSISVAALASGVYVLEVSSCESRIVKKVVKQ